MLKINKLTSPTQAVPVSNVEMGLMWFQLVCIFNRSQRKISIIAYSIQCTWCNECLTRVKALYQNISSCDAWEIPISTAALIGNEFGICPTNLNHCDDMWTNAVNFNPNWINIISINFNNSQTQSQSKHWWGSINSELFGVLRFRGWPFNEWCMCSNSADV